MPADPKLASVRDALSRAHNAARNGSREAQAGAIGEREAYVRSLLARSQSAARAWTNWEAINECLEPGSKAAEATNWLSLSALRDVRMSLARDAILGAFGLSDPAESDRLTLCRLAEWLDVEATQRHLSSLEWVVGQGYPAPLQEVGAISNAERVERLRKLVAPNWKAAQLPDPELADLRKLLRPTRNHLAHALHAEILDLPTINQIRRFIDLTLDLTTDAAVLWLGSAVGADAFREFHREQAIKFWRYAFAEPIAAWSRDMEQHRAAGIEP